MRVLVTGGSGQLGSVVLRRLIDDRKVKKIVSLDLAPPIHSSAKVDARKVDVRDPDLAKHFEGVDAVFHLAFVVTGKLPKAEYEAINIGGTQNVCAATAAAKVPQLIYASSIAAYGVFADHPDPVVESTPRRAQPEFPYAYCKYQVEAFLDRFEAEHPEIAIARMRPAILIGPRFGNPLAAMFGKAIDAGFLFASGDTPMPIVWDGDVADAAIAIWKHKKRGAWNLIAEPNTPRQIADAIGLKVIAPPAAVLRGAQSLSGIGEKLGVLEPVDPAWSKLSAVRVNISAAHAKHDLGWAPSCATAADVVARYRAEAPGAPSRKLALFLKSMDFASRRQPPVEDLKTMSARVHLALLGPGGGDFGIFAEAGKLRVRTGIPRPPTSTATMTVEVWTDLLAGRLDFASAQLTGKLRLEGDTSAGFLVGGLVRRFRNETEAKGWRGQTARRFARWVTE
jgi:UDP-glucose 4-epimerase